MSGPPYPRYEPGTAPGGSGIGDFVIGVSPIGSIPTFDIWRTIISQYANSPVLTQLCENFFEYLDQTADIDEFFDNIMNIDTAVGFGLDVWGRIVGVSRVLHVPQSTKYLGFEEAGTVTSDPFGQSPFFTGTPLTDNFLLSDAGFRLLIFAKALSNISDGSIASINQLLLNLFPGRGNAFVVDQPGGNDNATISLVPFDGVDASTVFPDVAVGLSPAPPLVWTPFGTAQIDTAQSKFGGGSGLFDGVNAMIFANPTTFPSPFSFKGRDFALDIQVRFASGAGAQTLIRKGNFGDADREFSWEFIGGSNLLRLRTTTNGTSDTTVLTVPWVPVINTWYWLSVQRRDGVVQFRVDGVQVGADQVNTDVIFTGHGGIQIGASGSFTTGISSVFNGWLDQARVSDFARWSGNVDAPIAAYTSGNMQMAYQFDFALSPVELAIVSSSGALPKPVGVAATVIQS